MRILAAIVFVLGLWGCAARVATAPIREQSEALRVKLMRTESEVYGDFHTLRTFQTDLFQCINRTDVPPYPALKALYDTLFQEANEAVGVRVFYDTTFFALEQAMRGKKKIVMQDTFLSLYERYKETPERLPAQQDFHRDAYFALRVAYRDSCLKYGIVRYDPQQYAGLLNEKLVQWQDSLEEVGRIVARCKADLKSRYPVQKGKEFFAAYAPVSELEAMMKNFESILNQFQNSISRFEEGNNQDFIYFGPYVRLRLEVSANDDLVGQLSIQMKDCRGKEREYFLGDR